MILEKLKITWWYNIAVTTYLSLSLYVYIYAYTHIYIYIESTQLTGYTVGI